MSPAARSAPVRSTETPRLVALLDGHRAGTVHQDRNGRFRFIYANEWRDSPDAYPLSLSMPLSASEHGHNAINPFLWGLLPDNTRTLDHYGRRFGVSAGNPVSLLTHLGPDCAGAVQLAAPDRVDELTSADAAKPGIEWLTTSQIATELRSLREQGVPRVSDRTRGQFSLSGAQPKIALLEDGERWGRPSGRTPTNTILKPPSREFAGFAENEHFCLELATALELGAARSRVLWFGDEVAIAVARFDRQKQGRSWRRVHQEDACQALGVMPTQKYESDGGPGVRDIVMLLRDASQDPGADVGRFIAAIAMNWIVAATDGHAKNYALLHGRGRVCRLAPFYDVASFLPYADERLHRVKLAMKVGSEYLVRRVVRAEWESLAKSIGMPPALVIETVERVAQGVSGVVEQVAQTAIDEGLNARVINALAARVSVRARDCADAFVVRG